MFQNSTYPSIGPFPIVVGDRWRARSFDVYVEIVQIDAGIVTVRPVDPYESNPEVQDTFAIAQGDLQRGYYLPPARQRFGQCNILAGVVRRYT